MQGVKTGGFGSAAARDAYFDGVHDGIRIYAWDQDGTDMVGTLGTTLAAALEEVDVARKESAAPEPPVKPSDKPKPDNTLPKPEAPDKPDHELPKPGDRPKPDQGLPTPPRGKPDPEPEPEPRRGARK